MRGFIYNIILKIRNYVTNNRKRCITVAAVMLVFLVIGVICSIAKNTGNNKAGEDVAKETTQSDAETIILDAKTDNDLYTIMKKDGETVLYKNNKKEKNVEFDKLPVMNFNMETAEASDKILSYPDADKRENTGGQVYRGKQIYAEKYLSFLKESGYEIKTYVKTNSYVDVYLKKDDTTFRFIYIKKSEDSGAVIAGECKDKIPDSINQIIEEAR